MRELIEQFANKHAEACKILKQISVKVEEETNGVLTVCHRTDGTIQFYHVRSTGVDPLPIIKEMADDHAVEQEWRDVISNEVCYRFNIDRVPCCIVLDLE